MCVWKSSGWIWLLPISKKYFFHLVDIVTSNCKFFKKLSWWIHGMTFKHGWIRSWFLVSWSWSHSWRLCLRQILNNWKCRLFAFKSSASWDWDQSELSSSFPKLVKCTLWVIWSSPIIFNDLFTLIFKSHKCLSKLCNLFKFNWSVWSSFRCKQILSLALVVSNKHISGSIKVPSISMIVNGLETRSWCNKIFRGFLIWSWFNIPWFELLMESHTNRLEVNRIKNLKWWFHKKKGTMTMKWNLTTTRRFQSHFIWRKFNLVSLIQKSSYWNQWVFNVSDVEVQVKVTTTWSHSNKFPTIDFQWLTCHATKWGLCSSNWKKWPFWSKVLGTAVGCCSTVKKNPRSVNWWCNCQVLINESIFKVRKFDMIQSNSLQSLEVNTFIQRILRSWVQVGTTLIRGSNNWSNKYRIANTKST